tara:strand:- start:830 stop:1078 length:249 start_codon:yes stop_codon:yes gene_type:complete
MWACFKSIVAGGIRNSHIRVFVPVKRVYWIPTRISRRDYSFLHILGKTLSNVLGLWLIVVITVVKVGDGPRIETRLFDILSP